MSAQAQEVCTDCQPDVPTHTTASHQQQQQPAAAATATADILPPKLQTPHVIIEYCDRCRWAPRASWIQTELLLTFPTPAVRTISLIPLKTEETGGRFRVWVDLGDGANPHLVWDRKTEGGFPELKVLKQRIRNLVQPDLDLGHSDVKGKQK